MKTAKQLIVSLLVLCLLTACSGGGASSADSKGSADPSSAKAGDSSADAGTGAEAQSQTAEGTDVPDPEGFETYASKYGWSIKYDPDTVEIDAGTEDSVLFQYTGEQTGENYLTVEFIPDVQPMEALTARLEDYDEDAVSRDEGYVGVDKWCFTASVDDSDEYEVTIDYTAVEYKGGVILTTIHSCSEADVTLEYFASDTLHDMVNSMTFEDSEPQTLFSYYPGTYRKKDEAADAPGTIVLYEDHSGTMETDEEIPVLWTSTELMVKNEETSWEYTIEGNYLYLRVDDDMVEYEKDESVPAEPRSPEDSLTSSAKEMIDWVPHTTEAADPAAQAAAGQQTGGTDEAGAGSAESVDGTSLEKTHDEYMQEIEDLYTKDGPGTIGRIHKMQAFLMELSLHAKEKNPDFKVMIQGAEYLGFTDGNIKKDLQPSMMELIDGWGNEGVVGKDKSFAPNSIQAAYITLAENGKFITDTTIVSSEEDLENYISKAQEWGIVPFPRIGADLAQELYPGQRFADNFDYFWVEDTDKIGLSEYTDGSRDVNELTDAKTYLYNINGRPYDNWNMWDTEEAAFNKGSGDRVRITDSYACGLLVPSENGSYLPASEDPDDEAITGAIDEYGEHWDWWWRAAGLDENAGRETWLEALRNSDYDVIFIDSCYNHKAGPDSMTPLTREEVESLKTKPDGGRRLVLSYLAIGTAEQNRWYCQDNWRWVDPTNLDSTYSMKTGEIRWLGNRSYYIPFEATEAGMEAEGDPIPTWLAFSYGDEYPEESVVQWWHKDWRDIIINGGGKYNNIVTGDNTSSIDRIIDQGFDGVYLDNADSCWDDSWFSYEDYWEEQGGIPTE